MPRKDIVNIFATNMRRLRKERHLSQAKLAALAKLDMSYISDLERCKKNATLCTVQTIAEALGVEAYELLMERNEEKKK